MIIICISCIVNARYKNALKILNKIGDYYAPDDHNDATLYILNEDLFFKKLPLFMMNYFQRKQMLEFNINKMQQKADVGDDDSRNFLNAIEQQRRKVRSRGWWN